MERYFWSKGILKNQLEITRGSEQIGSIVWESLVGSKAHGMINGHRFILDRQFFLSKLEIYDANNQSLLGTIMINLFNPKSDIIINGKRFELEVKNFWQSRWSWKFNGDELITYQSNEFLSIYDDDFDSVIANNFLDRLQACHFNPGIPFFLIHSTLNKGNGL